MNEQAILEELLSLLGANDVKTRNEPLGGRAGGLCTVKGQKIFFVDTQASSAESAELCAQAVLQIVDIENIYLKPQIRQFIENIKNREKH